MRMLVLFFPASRAVYATARSCSCFVYVLSLARRAARALLSSCSYKTTWPSAMTCYKSTSCCKIALQLERFLLNCVRRIKAPVLDAYNCCSDALFSAWCALINSPLCYCLHITVHTRNFVHMHGGHAPLYHALNLRKHSPVGFDITFMTARVSCT
jgi:hypothetical protein